MYRSSPQNLLSLKRQENEKTGFSKKPDFPDPDPDQVIPVHRGTTPRSREVRRSKKEKKIRIFEKPDFPDLGPDQVNPVHRGTTPRSREVRRSKKEKNPDFRKTGFSGSGPGFPDLRASRCDRGAKSYLYPKFHCSSYYTFRVSPFEVDNN